MENPEEIEQKTLSPSTINIRGKHASCLPRSASEIS